MPWLLRLAAGFVLGAVLMGTALTVLAAASDDVAPLPLPRYQESSPIWAVYDPTVRAT